MADMPEVANRKCPCCGVGSMEQSLNFGTLILHCDLVFQFINSTNIEIGDDRKNCTGTRMGKDMVFGTGKDKGGSVLLTVVK